MEEQPKEVELRLTSKLRGGLLMGGLLTGFYGLLSCLPESHGGHLGRHSPWTELLTVLCLALLAGYRTLDEHYVLDLEKQECVFLRRWWTWSVPRRVVFTAPEVLAIGVQGRFFGGKFPRSWSYTPVVITRHEQFFELDESESDSAGFTKVCARAEKFAEMLALPLQRPEAERILSLRGDELVYLPRKSDFLSTLWFVVLAVIAVVVSVYSTTGRLLP